MATEAKTLDCYNCEKKCDEEKMPYSKVWIGKVCDECYEEEEEEKEFIGEYTVKCFEYDNESSWTEDYKDDYECALERFNWITDRGGLYRNEYTGKATYCDKVILCEKEYGLDEEMELGVWVKDEKLPQGNSAKKEEPTKLTSQNTGSKEEKMTEEQVFSFLNPTDPELICSKCPLPLTEDDMAMFDGTICESCLEEQEDTGFGTAYHDGSGFADCDPTGKGYKKCKEEGWSKDKWCSECVYLDTRQEEEEEESKIPKHPPWKKMEEKMKDSYETTLAFAWGKSAGLEYYATSGACCDEPIEDFWESLDRDYIRKEWRVKIFMDIYDDYIIFNGKPYSKDDFEVDYEDMVDEKGNKIIQLETGEYVTKKKKIKLVVKK